MYDCIIAGGGPIGCYTAEQLANAGFSVLVIEEHPEIGEPVHCTGIVGEDLLRLFKIDESCVRYRIDSVLVHFPSGDKLNLPSPIHPRVVDRAFFDKLLAHRALQAGVEFLYNAHVEKIIPEANSVMISFVSGEKREAVRGKVGIIATGAMSDLPAMAGILKPESVYRTAQVDIEAENLNGIELFLGKQVAPGSFAYIVPVSQTASKVGLISRHGTRKLFENLLSLEPIKSRITRFSGDIRYRRMPFGVPRRTTAGRVLVIGDAACQLKSTTGGGLFYGLRCADIMASILKQAYDGNDFRISQMELYDKEWKHALSREIRVGLLLRNLLENVDDSWWNEIRKTLETPEALQLIRNYNDFDHHFGFMLKFFAIPSARKSLIGLARSSVASGTIFLNLLGMLKRVR